MTRIIYADILFLINLFADYIILFLTGTLSGCGISFKRLLLSSAAGAFAGTFAICTGSAGTAAILIVILTPPLLCFITFGRKRVRTFANLIFYFYLSSCLLYGGMYAMVSFISMMTKSLDITHSFMLTMALLFGVFLIYMLFSSRLRSGIQSNESYVDAELSDGKKSYNLRLLVDSGNIARDPFSSKPVAIISESVFDRRLINAVSGNLEGTGSISEYSHIKPRVIPLKTVNGTSLLYAFVPESLYILSKGKKIKADCIVAIDTHKNSFFGKDGIIPQSIFAAV